VNGAVLIGEDVSPHFPLLVLHYYERGTLTLAVTSFDDASLATAIS
jgi:hypothetical protein